MKQFFALVSMALLLSACSSSPSYTPVSDNQDWSGYQQQMSQLQRWQVLGKVAIKTAEQRDSASFSWQQQQDNFEISLFGPLNQLGARLSGDSSWVELQTDEGSYNARSPEQLLERHLGWQLPIRHIQWWVRGLPAPGYPMTLQLANERLSELNQAGWSISYSRYSATNSHPEKIRLSHPKLDVTLIIKEWQQGGE